MNDGEDLASLLIEWGRRQKQEAGKKQVLLDNGPAVELGRLTYKSSGTSLYLPKSVCRALNLDKEVNRSLVIVSDGSSSILLVKDTKMAEMLRPKVLEMRQAAQRLAGPG